MNITSTKTKFAIATLLVTFGVAGRLMPHAWNFAPIIAIGIFAGARLGKIYGFILPVLAMFISDAFIGYYDWRINIIVYASMGLSGAIGIALRNRRGVLSIVSGSIAGSTLFYLITNAAVWFFGHMYPAGMKGLMMSLSAGIPFYRSAIMGDLWYSLSFFGLYELALLIYRNKELLFERAVAITKMR